jgi:DNA-binding transcriptional LysR family regulator
VLEQSLGCRLLERHLGGYYLTDLGRDLLPYAERVEEAAAAFERRIASSEKGATGTLRITCAPTVGERLKRTTLVETFEARFPGLQVELLMGDRYFDLSKGEAEIAIRNTGSEPEDEALVGRKITDLNWALYASRAYVQSHGQPTCAKEIDLHRVVKCVGSIAERDPIRWLQAVAPNARVGAYSDSWSGLVLALKSGAGLAPLPVGHGDFESDLVRVIDIPNLVTHMYIFTHKDLQHSPRIRAFFDFVDSEIKAFREFLSGKPAKRR